MTPSELAEYKRKSVVDGLQLPPGPLTVEGCLLVSGPRSHIIDRSAVDSWEPCYGVLVPEDVVRLLDDIPLSSIVGSAVRYEGDATFICDVGHTGFPALPWQMTCVYEFTFHDKYAGTHQFKVNDFQRDLYIKVPEIVSARQIVAIQKYAECKITVMELKKKLVPGSTVRLSRVIGEEQKSSATSELEDAGIEVMLEHIAIGNYWTGPPKASL